MRVYKTRGNVIKIVLVIGFQSV